MIYQNNLKEISFNTQANSPQIATLKANDEEIGKLTAFPKGGKIIYYLDSILRNIAIQEDTPDFETKFRFTTPNVAISLLADNQEYTETLTCGTIFPLKNRLSNTQKRIAFDTPYQVTYFLSDAVITRLYGSVNGGAFVELAYIKAVAIPKGAFLTINYHQFYSELGATENDVINFKFDKLEHTETIKFNAQYTDFPFILVMRNTWGFWDTFRLHGNQESSFDFQQNSIENIGGVRPIYQESTEKLTIETGLLEQGEKETIARNFQNLDLFRYQNKQLTRLINSAKNIQSVNLRDTQDNLKLEFSIATITRRYQ